MGTTLTGTTPQDTYDSLIKVTDNGPLSGTAKYLSDGLGNDSVLALSTSRIAIGSTIDSGELITAYGAAEAAIVFQNTNSGTGTGQGLYLGTLNAENYLWTYEDQPMIFGANNIERMRITSTGNVGINTNAPSTKLSIVDNSPLVVGSSSGSISVTEETGTTLVGQGGGIFLGIPAASGSFFSTFIKASRETTDGASGAAALIFGTRIGGGANTERMRITSDGYLRMASGSLGIQFNGDTAAANALDDYEEGTWTPSLGGNTTYSAQVGTYTKIGRQVTIHFFVGVTTLGTGSASDISGLPFTVFASNRGAGGVAFVDAPSTGYASINPTAFIGTTTLAFVTSTILGVWADNSNVFANGTTISGTVTYFV
jgi:hypothetical protein